MLALQLMLFVHANTLMPVVYSPRLSCPAFYAGGWVGGGQPWYYKAASEERGLELLGMGGQKDPLHHCRSASGSARIDQILCVCVLMPYLHYHAGVLSLGMAPSVTSVKVNAEHALPIFCR